MWGDADKLEVSWGQEDIPETAQPIEPGVGPGFEPLVDPATSFGVGELPRGGTVAEFGKGLISSELGVAKGIVGTAEALLTIPEEKLRKVGTPWAPRYPTPEEQKRAAAPLREVKRRIASAQERFAMTHGGTGAWAGRVIGEAIPYMANALAAGYAVGPIGAAAVGFAVEGDNAYDAAIATGAPEGQAQRERVVVGSINAAIEALQIGRLMKFHQAGKHSIRNFIQLARDKAFKRMFTTGKQFGADILRLSIEEGLEEFAQEGVSISVPALFRGEYPKKEDGTIDYWALGERLGEAALGGAVAGGVLGAGGRVQIGVRVSESIPQAMDEMDLNMYGHAIPEILGMQEEERRSYMESLTGKRSMADMNSQEKEDFMWQLRKDADEAGIDLNKVAQEFQPVKELNRQLQSLKRYKKPMSRGAIRRRSKILKTADKIGELGQSYLLNQDRMKNICRMLGGYKDDGPLSRIIQEPIKAATVRAKDASNQLMWSLREAAQERGIDVGKMFEKKAKPEIVEGFPLSDAEHVGIYYLAQNPKARADVEAMFKEDGKDPDAAIKSIQEYVEKDDDLMFIYRQHRAYFDTMGPRFFDTVDQLDIKGVVKEENYITMLLNKGYEEGTADILQEFTSQFGLLIPGKKHIKERTGAIRDINLDIFSITAQASRSLERFINVAPVAKRVNDLIEDPKFKRNLNAATKDQGVKIFKRWLTDSARGTSDYNTTGVERIIKKLRRNAIVYTLGAKVLTVMPKQAISLSNAVAKRPAMFPAILKTINVMADPRVAKQLEERAKTKSSLVRNRSWERDLRAIYNDKNVRKFFEGKSLSPISMRPISWMDRKTVTTVWNSAYNLALADGLEEKQAIKYADDIVETTQPMADATDLPGYFRGGIAEKTFTTFMNQRNQNWQALRHDILGEYRAGEISKSMVMYRFLFSQILPSMMLGVITRGRLPEDAKEMGLDLASYMITPLIFGGRFIYNLVTGEWDPITSEISTIPARGPEEIVRGVAAAKRGDVRGAIEHGVGAVGAFTGKIPQQALTTTGGMIDLMIGETDDYKRLIYSPYVIKKYGEEEPTTGRRVPTRRQPE